MKAINKTSSIRAMNLAHSLCDSHNQSKIALNYLKVAKNDKNKFVVSKEEYTFGDMKHSSSKLTSFMRNIGVKKNDRIAVLLPKGPELMISGLAAWRAGAAYIPLFTAFGPEAIAHRVHDSQAKVIITDQANRPKLEQIPEIINDPSIKIITVNSAGSSRDFDFYKDGIQSNVSVDDSAEEVDPGDCIVLLYTSGTTAKPKGVVISAKSLHAFETYMKLGFHLQETDKFWNVADPGWAYGLYYNVLGTLYTGTTTTFVNAPFNPEVVYTVLDHEGINNFAAAPTAYRAIMAEGAQLASKFNFNVQRASSAGEPLNQEAIKFFEKIWGTRIRDHYGQTESGMTVCNFHHPDHREEVSGMGKPMPGWTMTILDEDLNEITEYGTVGKLAVDVDNSPLNFFGGYWNSPHKTKERIVQTKAGRKYELTGDTASRDQNGFFYFAGRDDDIISSSGFRVGPKEIEDVLLEHKAVKESGVVGRVDPLRGEAIVAFVVLLNGHTPSDQLAEELKQHVKDRLSRHLAPREIVYVSDLPYNEAGKIRRNVLRERLKQQ